MWKSVSKRSVEEVETYRMVLSMWDTVRYAARLAVYDEHTIKVKSHQLPITIRKATEPATESPPASRTA